MSPPAELEAWFDNYVCKLQKLGQSKSQLPHPFPWFDN